MVLLLHSYGIYYSLITVMKSLLKSVAFKTTCAEIRSIELDVHSAASDKPSGDCIEHSGETSFKIALMRQG